MIIKANNIEIPVSGIISEKITSNGKRYPALRFEFQNGVTEEQLSALCSGSLEIIDDEENVIGTHVGYTTRRGLSFVVGKIETAEQERDKAEQKLTETVQKLNEAEQEREIAEAALAVEEAKKPYIEKLVEAADDATASTVVILFPVLTYDGALIEAGTRINWNNTLKRAAVDLWNTVDNNPDNAPALWEDVLYKDGIRIIPENITATNPFAKGEFGWWGDVLYESVADNNVYTPEQYASNWKIAE